jgi:hypothetical protein
MADQNKTTSNPVPSRSDVMEGAIKNMFVQSEKLNASFVEGRIRMDEIADAVTRSTAGIVRLGGSINDVSETMAQIALGSRRNVIATEETVSKLFAAQKIIGETSQTIVENFATVGIDSSLIGENLEKSIGYVQSVGLNAKVIMGDVVRNMDMMNRFNFSNGVEGLTKMAAQASMLKFDMTLTADFADKVMSPEKAIEAAAGFQRLGVNIGNLVDPMALYNDSINNPGGLQDSLIKMTQKYTEFDVATQRFKINPQGILMMKELYDVTGISAKELSKAAIAAADLNRRVSMINPSIQFDNEDDKKLLANMATMRDNEYVVQIRNDETGVIEQRKLSDITKEEFQKLRDKQDDAPKTLEEIQSSQLEYDISIDATLKAILAKGSYGLAGAEIVRGNIMGADRISRELGKAAYDSTPESSKITEKVNDGFQKMAQLYADRQSGKINEAQLKTKILEIESNIKKSAMELGEKGTETLAKITQQAAEKITGNSLVEKAFRKFALGDSKVVDKKDRKTQSQVDFNGNLNINIDAPPGVSEKQFRDFFDSENFKQMVYSAVKNMKTAVGK